MDEYSEYERELSISIPYDQIDEAMGRLYPPPFDGRAHRPECCCAECDPVIEPTEDRITLTLRIVRQELEQLGPCTPGSCAEANGILKGLLDVLAETFLSPDEHAQVNVICDLHAACVY